MFLLFFCFFYSDPVDAPCQSGCLYTKHRPGDPEEWFLTSTARINFNSESQAYIIGLAGSFIPIGSANIRINVDCTGYSNLRWRLTTDFSDVEWDTYYEEDYYTDYIEVRAGYRYRFHIVTTTPLTRAQLWLYNVGSHSSSLYMRLETCEKSNFSCEGLGCFEEDNREVIMNIMGISLIAVAAAVAGVILIVAIVVTCVQIRKKRVHNKSAEGDTQQKTEQELEREIGNSGTNY
jgi:hypothetical protein